MAPCRQPWSGRFTHVAILLSHVLSSCALHAQNSLVGDGFGGRLWYQPTNYTVGSYSAFSLCYGDPCDTTGNQLYGWGGDSNGELGNGILAFPANAPVVVPGMNNVRYYSTGYWMGAIKNDGTGWVWNDPAYPFPTQVLTDCKFVDASWFSVSFVKHDGTVWTVCNPLFFQNAVGNDTATNFQLPVQMMNVDNAVRVAMAQYTTFVLLSDGTVLSMGANVDGILGDGSTDSLRILPSPVPELANIVDIKAHTSAAAALRANGDVYTWGSGAYIGDGDTTHESLPKRVDGLHDIVAISGCADGFHFLALDAYGNCYSWGDFNQLGSWNLAPVLVATDVIDIMAGETFSYIVKSDGSLWAAGNSGGGSIWLDLPNYQRDRFTRLDPSLVEGCAIVSAVAVPSVDCNGLTGTITVTNSGGQGPYQYDIGTGAQTSNVFSNVPAGIHTVTITDANGCTTTASCEVDLSSGPDHVVQFLPDTVCTGETYVLPSGLIVSAPGQYLDTVSAVAGCDTVFVVDLAIQPRITRYVRDTLCTTTGFAIADYALPSGRIVNELGTYLDTLVVPGACDTVYFVFLSQAPPISATASADPPVITAGAPVQLEALGGDVFLWWPSEELSCTVCPTPVASPNITTTYCVRVSDAYACSDTACVKIEVRCPEIFVPSAFSPNANGRNEQQCVYGDDCIDFMLFRIYDRWGNKVFETTDPKTCWDGLHNGQPLNPDVFVYHLSATLTNGETVEKQGNITLVR